MKVTYHPGNINPSHSGHYLLTHSLRLKSKLGIIWFKFKIISFKISILYLPMTQQDFYLLDAKKGAWTFLKLIKMIDTGSVLGIPK